jgi:hypothetical protein
MTLAVQCGSHSVEHCVSLSQWQGGLSDSDSLFLRVLSTIVVPAVVATQVMSPAYFASELVRV